MNKLIKAVVISDSTIQIGELHNGDDGLHRTVGGWLEHLDLGGGLHMWLNEDGKALSLPLNEMATAIALQANAIRPSDFIVGTCVLTGVSSDGELADCPHVVMESIRETCEKYGIRGTCTSSTIPRPSAN